LAKWRKKISGERIGQAKRRATVMRTTDMKPQAFVYAMVTCAPSLLHSSDRKTLLLATVINDGLRIPFIFLRLTRLAESFQLALRVFEILHL